MCQKFNKVLILLYFFKEIRALSESAREKEKQSREKEIEAQDVMLLYIIIAIITRWNLVINLVM